MLAHFLPTGTLLTFEMVQPSINGVGQCTSVKTLMTITLLILCALSCFFFHFTDSFRALDGEVYYGFVTPKGLAVFKTGLDVEVPKEDKYKVHLSDFSACCNVCDGVHGNSLLGSTSHLLSLAGPYQGYGGSHGELPFDGWHCLQLPLSHLPQGSLRCWVHGYLKLKRKCLMGNVFLMCS